MNQSAVDRSRARQVTIFSSMLMVVIFSPFYVYAAESNGCCESPDQFDLFLIGDPDNGELTPFESDLEEKKSVEVTSSVLGEVEIGSWMEKRSVVDRTSRTSCLEVNEDSGTPASRIHQNRS